MSFKNAFEPSCNYCGQDHSVEDCTNIPVKFIHPENQDPIVINTTFSLKNLIYYNNKHITGKRIVEIFIPDALEECGSCGQYHQTTHFGDCRVDNKRFLTNNWEDILK